MNKESTHRESVGRGKAVLSHGDIEFDARDGALLRAIHRTGSVAAATTELGQSRARALERIEALEAAFGALVERQRGGSGGGGSRLTATGQRLLARYDRLAAALAATASVPETVLSGSVVAVDGELADVRTAVGTLRGRHDGAPVDDTVDVRIGADALTVYAPDSAPEPDGTSARNQLRGTVSGVDVGQTVRTVCIDVDGETFRSLITEESAQRLELEASAELVVAWKATATQLVQPRRGGHARVSE